MSEIDKKWYVVRAIGGQENKAKGVLESEISAAGYGGLHSSVSELHLIGEKLPSEVAAGGSSVLYLD